MSTVAWGKLQAHVCQTKQDAERAKEFVRANIGKVRTFVILDELPSDSMERAKAKLNLPGDKKKVSRVIDLIKPKDEKFLPAFFWAFKNCLVTDGVSDAAKWSKENTKDNGGIRWKFVTKKGDIIEPSGALSGGGAKSKGGMKAVQDLEFTQEEAMAACEAWKSTQNEIMRISAEIRSVKDQRDSLVKDKEKACWRVRYLRAEVSAFADLGAHYQESKGRLPVHYINNYC